MRSSIGPALAFGPFTLDPQEHALLRDGQHLPLTPKAFELLQYLVERRGRLVRKEELLAAVWPGTFVEEAVLSVNISAIRKALQDDRNGHAYIETVPKLGYRFVAAARPLAARHAAPRADVAAMPTADEVASGDGAAPRAWRRVRRPAVAAAALIVGATGWLAVRQARGPVVVSSVAVLPLESLSGEREQAQFADAMTDLLITDLGRITSLRVVSRQSTLQYKTSRKPMPEIGRELHVEYVAEGTVVREGGRVRITAQLIHAPSDRHVWAHSYERDLGGTFAMQADVAESIAREIGVTVAGLRPRAPADQEVPAAAYEAYLRGNYLSDGGDSRGAIEQFRSAVDLYPAFAQAYARLASTYFSSGFFSLQPPGEVFPRMREAALRAIALDGANAEAHAALGEEKLHYDWDWSGADRELRRSLELNPNDSFVRHLYAHYKLTVGLPAESLDEMDRAFEIDPVGVFTAT